MPWGDEMPITQSELAKSIAIQAHEGQLDKAGKPYIEHPRTVADAVEGDTAKAVAWLHDVVEDSSMTFEDLKAAGIASEVINHLRLLTHDKSVPYMEYIAALKNDPVAREVKLADLRHNSDLSRLNTITDKDRERLAKYQQAMELLLS